MRIPANLQRIARFETGPAWLEQLPTLVSGIAEQWELELGEPYAGSFVSYVVPAIRRGERVVLKVQWPHEECCYEADALNLWDGDGAIRLLAHDKDRCALLLEHCDPGLHLAGQKSETCFSALINLLPRLWKPAGLPFKSLAQEAGEWRAILASDWETAGRPLDSKFFDAAMNYLHDLPDSQGEQVLVHQDLHAENILSAEREPWLVIDPKPLVGEREFAIAPIIRSFELGHSRAQATERLDRLSSDLSLDRERCRGWAIAQTVAGSVDSEFAEPHMQTVKWLMDA